MREVKNRLRVSFGATDTSTTAIKGSSSSEWVAWPVNKAADWGVWKDRSGARVFPFTWRGGE